MRGGLRWRGIKDLLAMEMQYIDDNWRPFDEDDPSYVDIDCIFEHFQYLLKKATSDTK